MMRFFTSRVFLLLLLPLIGATSCRKSDQLDTNPASKLSFSTDTVFFDTVFSSVGSVTKRLTVYNRNDGKVKISDILLAGGQSSDYRINIDGISSLEARDVEIPGHDSIFIFIRVTIDPNDQNTPFVVRDSIIFLTNGNQQDVKLMSWGQNARFLKDEVIKGNQVWDSLKPYVIFGYARLDTSATLTILAGTKIYFHWNSCLTISSDATLKITGSREHPVRFQGDRLDEYYRDLPGQWKGIYLERGSKENEINYAIIRNGIFGLAVDSSATTGNPMLQLDNTMIYNTTSDAIYAYSTKILSSNCVLGNCGGAALFAEKGGYYEFRHLTIANYWSESVRLTPSLYLRNFTYDSIGNQIPGPLEKAYFGNTIIYGADEDEIALDKLEGTTFNYSFDHVLMRTTLDITQSPYTFCIANEDPLFMAADSANFHIDSLSPAIGKGIPMGIIYDLDGNLRGSPPDLGAYQWVPSR